MISPRISRRAASLLELIVTISLLSLLMALLLPAVQNVRQSAYRLSCSNKMRQIGLALHQVESKTGCFPPVLSSNIVPGTQISCYIVLLPELGYDTQYYNTLNAYRIDRRGVSGSVHQGLQQVIKPFICPADGRLSQPLSDDLGWTAAYISYQGVIGTISLPLPSTLPGFYGILRDHPGLATAITRSGVPASQVTDGLSNTLHFGERPPPGRYLVGNWYTATVYHSDYLRYLGLNYNFGLHAQNWVPIVCGGMIDYGPGSLENDCDSQHFWSLHSSGSNFLFGDGSVRFLSYSARTILPALATINQGEVVTLPD